MISTRLRPSAWRSTCGMRHSRGDPRTIGVLSYLTPLGSTLCLVASTGRPFTASLLLAAPMITGAAAMAARAGR